MLGPELFILIMNGNRNSEKKNLYVHFAYDITVLLISYIHCCYCQ